MKKWIIRIIAGLFAVMIGFIGYGLHPFFKEAWRSCEYQNYQNIVEGQEKTAAFIQEQQFIPATPNVLKNYHYQVSSGYPVSFSWCSWTYQSYEIIPKTGEFYSVGFDQIPHTADDITLSHSWTLNQLAQWTSMLKHRLFGFDESPEVSEYAYCEIKRRTIAELLQNSFYTEKELKLKLPDKMYRIIQYWGGALYKVSSHMKKDDLYESVPDFVCPIDGKPYVFREYDGKVYIECPCHAAQDAQYGCYSFKKSSLKEEYDDSDHKSNVLNKWLSYCFYTAVCNNKSESRKKIEFEYETLIQYTDFLNLLDEESKHYLFNVGRKNSVDSQGCLQNMQKTAEFIKRRFADRKIVCVSGKDEQGKSFCIDCYSADDIAKNIMVHEKKMKNLGLSALYVSHEQVVGILPEHQIKNFESKAFDYASFELNCFWSAESYNFTPTAAGFEISCPFHGEKYEIDCGYE